MSSFFDFLAQHPVLTGLLVLLAVALVVFEMFMGKDTCHISAEEVVDLVNHNNAVVLDFRDEYKDGHISGSIKAGSAKLTKYVKREVVVVADKPSKSRKELLDAGLKNVYILDGGITAWLKAGLPLVK